MPSPQSGRADLNLVLAGRSPLPIVWEQSAEEGEAERLERLEGVAVSQFCSDSPGPGGRGGLQPLLPLLCGAVLRLGQWEAGTQKEATCAAGSQSRQLRLTEPGSGSAEG